MASLLRVAALASFCLLTSHLWSESFHYQFTARVAEIRQNQANYLGGLAVDTILEGSFGVTDQPLPGPGQYRSVFLELETPEQVIRVDFPPPLYCWWREGHFELSWDDNGSIQLPWMLSAFAINLEGYAGSSHPDYLAQLNLNDFSTKTLTLSGEHLESGSDFDISLELVSLQGSETPGKRFYVDSGIRFFSNDTIRALAFADECLWLGGSGFYRPNGRQPLERLFLNGEADESFNIVGGFHNADGSAPVIHRIERMPDGDLFVAGWFSHYMDVAVGHYARLNPDGSLDPDFLRNRRSKGKAAGADGLIRAIQRLPDGNYLLGGDFSKIDGVELDYLAMVRPTGERVPDWTGPALTEPQHFDSIEDFALSPSGLEAYVAGDFTFYSDGLRSEGIFRLNLTDGAAESLDYLNPPTSGILQVDLRPDGALVILEMPSQGGALWIHPDPVGGAGEFSWPGDSSSLQMYNIACFTVLEDGRLLAVGEFNDPETERDFNQALFSSEGHYLPDAFGQSIRVWPHEARALLAEDGSVWLFGDYDMDLATSDAATPNWINSWTHLTRWVELMPPPASSPIQVVLGETDLHSQDGQTAYIPLLRTGATEGLDVPLDGHLEMAWSAMSPELNEHDDYSFPGTHGGGFEFQAFERLVSIPVSFLTNRELAHQSEGGRIAAFAPDYAGAPFPGNTSTNQRTQVQIEVADATVDKLTALQTYFPEITDLNLNESQPDPDQDGRDSLTEILMRTDPRTPDTAPQLKLFRRMHPQDAQAVWVLELPFDGTLEQGHFQILQSDTTLGEPLQHWQAFAENNHQMGDQRHRATNERETLLYGDPHGKGSIGLKLDPGEASSSFWEALYLSF